MKRDRSLRQIPPASIWSGGEESSVDRGTYERHRGWNQLSETSPQRVPGWFSKRANRRGPSLRAERKVCQSDAPGGRRTIPEPGETGNNIVQILWKSWWTIKTFREPEGVDISTGHWYENG